MREFDEEKLALLAVLLCDMLLLAMFIWTGTMNRGQHGVIEWARSGKLKPGLGRNYGGEMRGWKPEIDTDLKSGTKIEWEEVVMILTLNKNEGRSTFHQTLVSYLGKGEELADRQGDRWVWQPWRWVAQVTIHWRKGNTSPFLGGSFQVDLELTLISENLKCQYGPPLRIFYGMCLTDGPILFPKVQQQPKSGGSSGSTDLAGGYLPGPECIMGLID